MSYISPICLTAIICNPSRSASSCQKVPESTLHYSNKNESAVRAALWSYLPRDIFSIVLANVLLAEPIKYLFRVHSANHNSATRFGYSHQFLQRCSTLAAPDHQIFDAAARPAITSSWLSKYTKTPNETETSKLLSGINSYLRASPTCHSLQPQQHQYQRGWGWSCSTTRSAWIEVGGETHLESAG